MRKILTLGAILIAVSLLVTAQEDTMLGPQSGSLAIGIAANPAFVYLGNIFGKTVNNNAPTVNLANDFHVFGKYFISDKSAIRAGASLDYGSETSFFGDDDKNKLKESESYIALAFGLEKRFGHNRAQAFFGPSVGLSYSSAGDVYKYDENPATGVILKRKYGSSFGFALGGFGGVEYFVSNNIALGTEIGIGLNISSTGKGTLEREGVDDVETGNKSQALNFGFNNTPAQLAPRGVIYLSIYIN